MRLIRVWIVSCVAALIIAALQAAVGDEWRVDPLLWWAPPHRLDPRDFETWYDEERAPRLPQQSGYEHVRRDLGLDNEDQYRPSHEDDSASVVLMAVMTLIDTPHVYAPLLFRAAVAGSLFISGGGGGGARLTLRLLLPLVAVGGLFCAGFVVDADVAMALLTYIVVAHNVAQAVAMLRRSAASGVSLSDPDDADAHGVEGSETSIASVAWPVALCRASMLAPVALWMTERGRGLDWFHFDVPHLLVLPRALAALCWLAWGTSAVAIAVALVRAVVIAGGLRRALASRAVERWVAVALQAVAWGALHIEDPEVASVLLTVPHAIPSLVFVATEALERFRFSRHLTLRFGLAAMLLLLWSCLEHFIVATIGGPHVHPWRLLLVYALPQLLHVMVDPLCAQH